MLLRGLYRQLYSHQQRHSPYHYLYEPAPVGELVALDFETTSLNASEAEIVSIGAVKIVGKQILHSQRLDLKLRPGVRLGATSIKVHRLRHQDLQQGLPPQQGIEQLLEYIGPRPLVGYNIAYDFRILKRYAKQLLQLQLVNQLVDVGQLYADRVHLPHEGMPANQDLAHICDALQIPLSARHQAYDDALNAAMIYLRLQFGPRPSAA